MAPRVVWGPFEGNRDVIVQADAHVFRVVEDDVGALRNEADVEEQVGEVGDANAGTGGQSGEPSCRREAMQVGDHVLDVEPARHASGHRRVERVEVDHPSGRGERLGAAVGEGEGHSRDAPVACEAVPHELPPELERGLGGAGPRREGQQWDGQCDKESVGHAGD